jgi:hypothetical protein
MVELETLKLTIWRRVVCWISKATHAQAHASARAPRHTHTHTHTEIRNPYFFSHDDNSFVNAPQYYVIRTLPLLLFLI